MSAATTGDTVQVHYKGQLTDGTVFDDSHDRDPLQFTLGAEQVISGFENAITGMEPGDQKRVEVAPDEGYGPRRDDMILQAKPEQFQDKEPEVGDRFQLQTQEGRTINAVVADVSDQSVTLDANHPLAGRDLVFDIELVKIV